MQHLQKKQDKYQYTGPVVNDLAVKVEVDYWKTARQRGVYLSVRPETVRDGMVQWVMGSGCNILVAPLARKNDKAVVNVAIAVDKIVPDIAAAWIGVPNSMAQGEAGQAAIAAIRAMLIKTGLSLGDGGMKKLAPATRVGMWYATGPADQTYTSGNPAFHVYRVVADTCDVADSVLVESAGGERFPVPAVLIDQIASTA